VESPRGAIEVTARVGHVMPGAVFAPFHYGTWDTADLATDHPGRQANELTMTVWDPVSKQPYFKTAACQVTKVHRGTGPSPAPTTAASAPASSKQSTGPEVAPTAGGAPTTSTILEETPHYPLDPSENRTVARTTRTEGTRP